MHDQGAVDVGGPISGRVQALAYASDLDWSLSYDHIPRPALFLGSANGGIWRTTSLKPGTQEIAANPTWVDVTPAPGDLRFNGSALTPDQADGLLRISCITIPNPKEPSVLWVGTGDLAGRGGVGILSSQDGGRTWSLSGHDVFAGKTISKIVVNPLHPSDVYASVITATGASNQASDGGVYKLSPLGVWSRLDNFIDLARAGNGPSAVIPTDMDYVVNGNQFTLFVGLANRRNGVTWDSSVYNSANSGIWATTNDGVSWRKQHTGILAVSNIDMISFAADHRTRDNSVIYAAASYKDDKKDSVLQAVIVSTNSGGSWDSITPGAADQKALGTQGWYDLSLNLDPANPSVVYLGGAGSVLKATNGSAPHDKTNWTKIDPVKDGLLQVHVDHHAGAFSPGGVFYDGNDGGAWKYTSSAGWIDLNNAPLNTMEVNSVAAYTFAGKTLYVEGSQDNGLAGSYLNDKTWQKLQYPAGDGGRVRFTPTGVGYYMQAGSTPQMMVSQDTAQGLVWTKFTGAALPPDDAETIPFYPAFALSSTGSTLVFGTDKVWERQGPAGSRTWKQLSPALAPARDDGTHPKVTALTYANDNTIYVGYSNGDLYKTTTHGGNGTDPGAWGDGRRKINIQGPWGSSDVTSIIVDPATLTRRTGNIVYVTVEGYDAGGRKVWRSTNGGATWTDISAPVGLGNNLPNSPVFALVLDTRDPNFNAGIDNRTVYVGNDLGVYRSSDNGASWFRVGDNFPIVQVTDLQIVSSSDGDWLVASTFGRGVYRIKLDPPPARRAAAIEGRPAVGLAVAAFPDAGSSASSTVTLDWGDGAPLDATTGHITTDGVTDTVLGDHTYAESGEYTVTATVTLDGVSSVYTGIVDVSDAPLTASPLSIPGSSFSALTDAAVATFTDDNPTASASEFTAEINWGDGVSSDGTVAYADGSFTVAGSHTYTNAGSYTVSVSIQDVGGAFDDASSTAVINGPVTAQTVDPNATEGLPVDPSTAVATFTAPGGGSFIASIDWGDGNVSAGVVTLDQSGVYTVSGGNTYTEAGAYHRTLTIANPDGTVAAVVGDDISVADAPLTASALAFAPAQGAAFTDVAVASFSDANPNGAAADFGATIDWGDGGDTSGGAVVAQSDGTFTVLGDHTYLRPGSYTVVIDVWDVDGAAVTISEAISVSPSAPNVAGISATYGDLSEPASVLIVGSNLYDATAVSFGGVAASSFVLNDDGSITAVAPTQSAGTVDVTVTTPYGTSSSSAVDQFTYVSGIPTVGGLSSTSGPTEGDGTVTITGTNLAGVTAVWFGNVAASFTLTSPTTLDAIVPDGAAGVVDVTVEASYGTSATSTADLYTYGDLPHTVAWVGGPAGDWWNPANWSTGVVPGSSDDVLIGAGVTVTISSGAVSIDSLTDQGALVLSGGSLALAGASSIADLALAGGNLSGAGSVAFTDAMTWTDGALALSGVADIAPGASLVLNASQGSPSLQGGTLFNTGAVVVSGTGGLGFSGGAVLDNQAGAQFDDQTDVSFTSLDGTGAFLNEGTFLKSGGTGSTVFGAGLTFANTGVVEALSGTLLLSGSGSSDGAFQVASGAALDFNGSSYALTANSSVAGAGSLVFSGTASLAGTVDVAGGVSIDAGAVVTASGSITGTLTNAGVLIVASGGGPGILTLSGDFIQTSAGTLVMLLNGPSASAQFSQLNISGSATLGGTLSVVVSPNYTPPQTDAFALLTFRSGSGAFASYTGLQHNGYALAPHYDSTDFGLVLDVFSFNE